MAISHSLRSSVVFFFEQEEENKIATFVPCAFLNNAHQCVRSDISAHLRIGTLYLEPHPLTKVQSQRFVGQSRMAAATAENGASSPPPTSPQSSAEALSTEHLYYEDTELYTNTGHVTGQWDTEMNGEKRTCIVLDRTVMHPQGGVCVL